VAGLLRSLDYAVATAVRDAEFSGGRLSDQQAHYINQLLGRAQRAFLDAYCESVRAGLDIDLLCGLLIEKAAYEISYEAANRPKWLPVPISGLNELADQLPSVIAKGDHLDPVSASQFEAAT
jgi:maltose alpha-D-glucosyltransferase / alpha-amylase